MLRKKQEVIALHESELEKWEVLLSGLSMDQITKPVTEGGVSVKDTIAHLGAWLKRTISRLEAALHDHELEFPQWPVELDKDESEQAVDCVNAWILEDRRNRDWEEVYRDWRKNYLHFLEVLKSIPKGDFRPNGKLAWVTEYELLYGYTNVYDYHHAEHRLWLEERMRNQAEP